MKRTACKLCRILLIGREQTIGHLIHSHEFKDDEAQKTWQLLTGPKAEELEVMADT